MMFGVSEGVDMSPLKMKLKDVEVPNAVSSGQPVQTAVPPAQTVGRQEAVSEIPNYSPEEVYDIDIAPMPISAQQEDVTVKMQEYIYKLHAQNKQIDALPSYNYSQIFFDNVVQNAAGKADELFPVRVKALRNMTYNFARLHQRINEDTLFDIKIKLMPALNDVINMEVRQMGGETENSKQINFYISYMQEKQVYEIIEVLKQNVIASFPESQQEYAAQIANQIANLSKFLGWCDGLKSMGYNVQISVGLFGNLNRDLSDFVRTRNQFQREQSEVALNYAGR